MFNFFYLPCRPDITGWQGTLISPTAEEVSQPENEKQASLIEVITERRKIVHMLRTVADSRQPVMISSLHLPGGIQTRLLSPSPESSQLLIRQVANDCAHSSLLADQYINLLMEYMDSPLLCSLPIVDTANDHGNACYVTSIPEWLMFSQMRSSLRVKAPVSLELVVKHEFDKRERLEADIVDLSEDGIGLVIPHLPLRRIRIDEKWHKAMICGVGTHIGPVDLSVRHFQIEGGEQHIGAMFINLTEPIRQQSRRLSLKLQSHIAKRALT